MHHSFISDKNELTIFHCPDVQMLNSYSDVCRTDLQCKMYATSNVQIFRECDARVTQIKTQLFVAVMHETAVF